MLPKTHRFTARKEIRQVFQHGFRKQSHSFVLVSWQPTERINLPWRVTIIVSKKIAPLATIRNAIRRKISEVIWQQKDLFKNGTDAVILAQKQSSRSSQQKLQQEFQALIN